MNHRISIYLVLYAGFLIVSGSIGYALNPAHAITALLGGVGGGIMMLMLSRLYRRKVMWAQAAVNAATGVFALTFIWRAIAAWQQFALGQQEKMVIAIMLSIMFIVSAYLLMVLLGRGSR